MTEDCEDSPVKGYEISFFGSYQVTVCGNSSNNPHFFSPNFLKFSKFLKKYPEICI